MSLFKMHINVIFGPDIQNHNRLPDDLIYIDDHIGHDDDPEASWHLDRLMRQRSPDAKPVLIEYVDSNELSDQAKKNCIFLPLQPYYTNWVLNNYYNTYTWAEKLSAFNFMINKNRKNRQILLKMLDQLNLSTDTYSLTWQDSFEEYNIKSKYFKTMQSKRIGDRIANRSWSNPELYMHWLKDHVFEPSIVSLISEPDWKSKTVFISEKTIFAYEAGTIPIWVGGWNVANHMKKLGFHTFDDIIDHSYQSIEDPVIRCQAAIDLNHRVLSDFDLLLDYWVSNRKYFEKNWELCRSGSWFYELLVKQLKKFSIDAKDLQKITIDLIINRNYEIPSWAFKKR